MKTDRNRTARKVLGSLAAIGGATAVAGLGTFGTFTDSTSVDTTVKAGALSIDLSVPSGIKSIPVTTSGFLPGDSLTRAIDLANGGTLAMSSVNLATTASASNPLVTDPVHGLQLSLEQCSKAWTKGGTPELPTYTCGGAQRTLYSGPVISTDALPTPNSLAPGGTDKMVFTLSLPTTAGNEMQSLNTTVSIAFTAVQGPGQPR
jgi:hypothetical protein